MRKINFKISYISTLSSAVIFSSAHIDIRRKEIGTNMINSIIILSH